MKKVGDDAFRSGDSGTAAACYSLALKRDGQNAKLWSNRSAAFAKLGDPGRAFDDARKVRGSSVPTGTQASRTGARARAQVVQGLPALRRRARLEEQRRAPASGLRNERTTIAPQVEHAYWYYAMASSLDARDAGHQTAKLDCLKRLVKEDGLQARKRDALFKRDAKLKPSAVRVWACSDVHYDHHGAPEWADALSDTMYQRDSLLLAGDIADTLYGVELGAGNGRDIANFYLGRFPLVSAYFWTSDHFSERSRSVDAFFFWNARARNTQGLIER